MWLGATGCARGSQTCRGMIPALVPNPISAATITSVCGIASALAAPRLPWSASVSSAIQTPAPPRCVIARYTNTARRTASSRRATRIAVAGMSVMSSQKARNDVTSRAATTPSSDSRNAAVSPTSGRRTGESARPSRANSSAGSAATAMTTTKNALRASMPNRGPNPL